MQSTYPTAIPHVHRTRCKSRRGTLVSKSISCSASPGCRVEHGMTGASLNSTCPHLQKTSRQKLHGILTALKSFLVIPHEAQRRCGIQAVLKSSKILIYCLLLLSNTCWATLTASVDRNMIASNETFNLYLTSDQTSTPLNPQLGALTQNFQIIGTANSSEVSVINGKQTQQQQLMITLMPKSTGTFTIPALTVGNDHTTALRVTVNPPLTVPQDQKKIFIEASITPAVNYPKVQSIYTVKLFSAFANLTGDLSLPDSPDLQFKALGDTMRYHTLRGRKAYQVNERRYSVTTDKPGSYTIPAVVFTGSTVPDNNISSLIAADTLPVHASSKALTLTIKAPPAHSGDFTPATKLTLNQSWTPNPPVFQVGQPVTRTVQITAIGLAAEQLPDLSFPNLSNVNSYPSQPILQTTTDKNIITGTKSWQTAYIPTQAGAVTLPAISVQWWNTQTQQFVTATLPAQQITITPATTTAPQPATVVTPPAAPATPAPDNEWRWLALGFLIAWLLTFAAVIGYWFWRKRRNTTPAPSGSRRALQQACASNDPQQMKTALLAWAKTHWSTVSFQSLADIMQRPLTPELRQALQQLDAALYRDPGSSFDGAVLWQALQAQLAMKVASVKDKDDLPPLYPE